jgi:hypothetical protein
MHSFELICKYSDRILKQDKKIKSLNEKCQFNLKDVAKKSRLLYKAKIHIASNQQFISTLYCSLTFVAVLEKNNTDLSSVLQFVKININSIITPA